MKTAKTLKKHGIKNIWIISYLVVFLVPLFVGMIAGILIYNGYRAQVENRNNIVLDTVCTTVDGQLEAIVSASMQLYNNEKVKEIGRYTLPLTPENEYAVYEFVKEFENIRGYETVQKYSDMFFVYFSSIDYVGCKSSMQPSESFYDAYINKSGYNKIEWNEFITSKYDGDFLNLNLLSDENDLLFVRTINLRNRENSFVNAVYKINTKEILSNIENLYFYEYGSFSITDNVGRLIMTTDEDFDNENKYGNRRNLLSFVKVSEATGWTYTYTLPSNKAYGNMYKILVTMIILYALCLITGIWLIKYFIKRNYKPIDNLMTLFPNDEGGEKDDEFSFLNKKITESLSHNLALNQEIDSQSKLIKEHLISEMIMGRVPVGKRSRTELEKLQFDVENNMFVVLIYSLGNNDDDDITMKHLVLSNVTDELLGNEKISFASTKKDEDIVYIVSVKSDGDLKKICSITRFLDEFTKKEFGFKFFGALGNVHQGAKGVGKSYNEAKRALEYAIAAENTEFVQYSEVASSLKDGYFFSVELESQLVTLIKANEYKKAKHLLEEIFSTTKEDDASIDSVRHLTIELFSAMKRLLIQYGYSIEKEYPEECEFVENIFDNRDIAQMQKTIEELYSKCCKDVFAPSSQKDDLIGGVVLYINQNYSNQNLGIRLIGDAFSMNPDYMSRKFRENTGKTINDYIRDIRLEKAKQLLRETDALIADVAEMVGFTSYRTFVRVFTEVVGVTPNKYKTMK